jgi:4-aminobutyrate aminotransferase-like enzyme
MHGTRADRRRPFAGIREGSTLRLAPPLTVTTAEIDEALATLEDAISAVVAVSS